MTNDFDELIKIKVNPLMKGNGYKKNGLNYYNCENDFIFIINIQKSQGNTSDTTIFYINCGIYFKQMELKFGNNVFDKPKIVNCQFEKRIEQITKNDNQFYEISKDINIGHL